MGNELVTPALPVAPPKPLDPEARWKQWRAAPGPQADADLLKDMGPVIDKAATAQVGKLNPLIKSRARTVALAAFDSYDPRQGRLVSHLYNRMQSLRRYSGQLGSAVRVPERVVLDRRMVDQATRTLQDDLGRHPTDDELSDHTGFSHARLAKLRRARPALTTGMFEARGDEEGPAVPAVQSDGSPAWTRMIYDELAPADKKVMEWSLGFNGQPVLAAGRIAQRLRRSPGWVSQRRKLIQEKLDSEFELSPF